MTMLSTLATVWLVHLAATATPGANTLLVLQLAASDKQSPAIFAAVGIAVGSAAWAGLAVLGVNAVFTAFPHVRLVLQVFGGAYLLWLAVKLWGSSNPAQVKEVSAVPGVRAFRLGLLTNFSNPKAAVFFGSVFSASFPPNPSGWLLSLTVAVVFMNAICWYNLVAYVFSQKAVRAAYLANSSVATKVTAAILGGLGLHLAYRAFEEV